MKAWAPAIVLLLVVSACGANSPAPGPGPDPIPPPATTATLVGAGDIGWCGSDGGPEQTAALLDTISGTVFTAGDNAYFSGTTLDFTQCYQPSWGRHKGRTRPTPGNHEYIGPGALGYFAISSSIGKACEIRGFIRSIISTKKPQTNAPNRKKRM